MREVSLDDKVVLLDQPKSYETHEPVNEKKFNGMNFGCFFKMIHLKTQCQVRGPIILLCIFVVFCLIGLPIINTKYFHKHHSYTPPDDYTIALNKAVLSSMLRNVCIFYHLMIMQISNITFIYIYIYMCFIFVLCSYITFHMHMQFNRHV